MSKFVLRSVMAVGVAAVIAAFAQPVHAEGEKAEKPKKRNFTGEVVSVDAAKSTITLKNKKNEEKTFTCSDKCKISVGEKETAALSDLKVGDKITASYTDEGGKLICTKMSPPKAPEKKDKEAKEKKAN